jgi:hypothetical protein
MHKNTVIAGVVLIAIGIIPVSAILWYGNMVLPPASCNVPFHEGSTCSFGTPLLYLWFITSFFFVGIGGWFLFFGLKSYSIITLRKS